LFGLDFGRGEDSDKSEKIPWAHARFIHQRRATD
jgi:hypothetical protein